MAKKSTKIVNGKTDTGGRAVTRGKETAKKIQKLADMVVTSGMKNEDPALDIPTRNLSNVTFHAKRRILQMGDSKQVRNFFNLGQAKKFMQTLLIAQGAKDLIDEGKTASIRGLYYKAKHTIAGTNEKTFIDQDESDPIIEDLEVALNSLREELHVFAKEKGKMVGNLTIDDNGDTIDLRRMGTGGYAIPSIVEPDVIQFKKCEAKFILHVEKGTVWSRFNEDRFWEKHNCILTEGGGQPPRGVRRLLYRLHNELKLPVYCLLDNDPWGYYIYSVIKQGSINLAYESQRMAIPDAKYLGLRSIDYERCGLSDDVKIDIDDGDIKRANQIAKYDWFKDKKEWQKEISKLLSNGFKMEVESLISKSISYVTEEYVPERLKKRDWLD
jgi:DNA topoisomerase-6 subunit A